MWIWMQIKYYIKHNFAVKFYRKITQYNILFSSKYTIFDPSDLLGTKYSINKFIDSHNVSVKKQKYRLQ